MSKKILSFFMLFLFIISECGTISLAQANEINSVQMILPEYLITIKGEAIENENAQ